ncbi:MAG: hypothetical protein ABIH08_07870 [Candidatus Omnitrophota bacterium]
MSSSILIQDKTNTVKVSPPISLDWVDNPSVQKLLDVIVSILAEEYVEIAKKNKDVFMDYPVKPDNDKGHEGG